MQKPRTREACLSREMVLWETKPSNGFAKSRLWNPVVANLSKQAHVVALFF